MGSARVDNLIAGLPSRASSRVSRRPAVPTSTPPLPAATVNR
ncbi:hypothetical protein [Actinoplanes sp. NPDC051411]